MAHADAASAGRSGRWPPEAKTRRTRQCAWRVIACALVVGVCGRRLLIAGDSPPTKSAAAQQAQHQPNGIVLDGTLEDLGGAEVVWQLPSAGSGPPRGLLLAFHGCSHGAPDWWPQGPSCASCIGLPEEVAITATALARGYGVLAVSSQDRRHRRCWSVPHAPESPGEDITAVVSAVKAFVQRQQLHRVPLYAVGASSGGALVLTLSHYLRLKAACSQIMALSREWYHPFVNTEAKGAAAAAGDPRVPVLFVHMPRDTHTAEAVADLVSMRQSLGLSSHVLEVHPQPVTPALLARAPELRGEVGPRLVTLLKAHGVLDEAGMLTQDPRHVHLARIVRGSSIPGADRINVTPDKSGLNELLNVAWASHEASSAPTEDMLAWFEQQQQQQGGVGAPEA